jgi:hypothetical protein
MVITRFCKYCLLIYLILNDIYNWENLYYDNFNNYLKGDVWWGS